MQKKRRKFSRQRGSKGHGWGHKKKHRGGGSRGGRGGASLHKHKYSYVVTKEPDHFGKKGFAPLKRKEAQVINVGDLSRLAEGKTELDLASFGYTKLLAEGTIDKPLRVAVASCSAAARAKVGEAGGTVVTESAAEEPEPAA